jgi:ubiquitin-protein ligase
VETFQDNCGHWTVTMPMAGDLPACPYAGRALVFDVNILWDYPKSPPTVTLTSEIFHPHFFRGCNPIGCVPKPRWHERVSRDHRAAARVC